jgi:hypothetical protein
MDSSLQLPAHFQLLTLEMMSEVIHLNLYYL